jgi:hypothetical protein
MVYHSVAQAAAREVGCGRGITRGETGARARSADLEGVDVDGPAGGEFVVEVFDEGGRVVGVDEELEAVATAEAGDPRGGGAADVEVGVGGGALAELGGEAVGFLGDEGEAGVAEEEAGEAAEGGVAVLGAPAELVLEEGVGVVVDGGEDCGVIGLERLDDDAAVAFSAAGAAGDLDEELEGALAGSEVALAE